MDFRQALSAELPPPRDDEPPSLRQDILDELADHLACAYKRELLRGAAATVAQTRVLEQFGDPAAVARRLWFDAMKGKIMTQRIAIGACLLLLTGFCGAAVALFWQQSLRAQLQAAEANAQLAHALAQSQSTNQEMLKQLQTMAQAFQPGQTPDWIPVSFKLTQESLDGPPAVGYEVALGRGTGGAAVGRGGMGGMGGGMGNSAYAEVVHRVSDQNGLVDFGVVQPGDWQFDLVRRWKDQNTWHAHGSLNVLPGIKIVKSIICPKVPPDTEDVTLSVDWPADLADRQYAVQASFQHAGIAYQPPLHWSLGPTFLPGSFVRNLLCGTREGKNKQADLRLNGSLYLWRFADPSEGGAANPAGDENQRGAVYADLPAESARFETGAVRFDVGRYNLTRLVILRSRPPHQLKVPGERFDVLAYAANQMDWDPIVGIQALAGPPDEIEPAYPWGMGMGQGGGMGRARNQAVPKSKSVGVSGSFWAGPDAHFEVQRGAPRAFKIQLPDELIRFLREDVKAKPSASAKAS